MMSSSCSRLTQPSRRGTVLHRDGIREIGCNGNPGVRHRHPPEAPCRRLGRRYGRDRAMINGCTQAAITGMGQDDKAVGLTESSQLTKKARDFLKSAEDDIVPRHPYLQRRSSSPDHRYQERIRMKRSLMDILCTRSVKEIHAACRYRGREGNP